MRRAVTTTAIVVVSLAGLLPESLAEAAESPEGLWRDVARRQLPEATPADPVRPAAFRALTLDLRRLDAHLASVPREAPDGGSLPGEPTLLALPLPDDREVTFEIVESPVMADELSRRYPEIRTYRGWSVGEPGMSVRLDRTPAGLHAMVGTPEGYVFIDPLRRNDPALYMSYRGRDHQRPDAADAFRCRVDGFPRLVVPAVRTSGAELRTYRVAIAATGEYTQFHGGTVPLAMAAIVTALNRVVMIYEAEVAVRMVLVANNDQIVYTNGATDPYTNNDGSAMLAENQANVDAVIGTANYDIGHVFSTGGGGIATLQGVCWSANKARGVTGLSTPIGDPFYVDYVAHEMGHQFGGRHTFNGTTGACGGGNRSASTAYEPGSGSTIQAYAGICGAENLQSNTDPYFHGVSFDEIFDYTHDTQPEFGGDCPVVSATGNTPPTANAGADYTIPASTPFVLTGSGTDGDGDSLTYGWEQFDLGTAAPPNTDDGMRPIFRSFVPTSDPSRTFPQLSDVLNGTTTFGEILPTTSRDLNFRLTVRDDASGGGGVENDMAIVTVTNTAGPYTVTSQGSAVTWTGGSAETVTWNVAGTTSAPVSCSQVDIALSLDGGLTFPIALESATPNDGTESVAVPTGSDSTTARVRVMCTNNVFFDVNATDFVVEAGTQEIFSDDFETGDTTRWSATVP